MANSTRSTKKSKHQGAKPYPEFPLTYHPSGTSGRWSKKHNGTRYYFGSVADGWEAAYAKWERDWPYIIAGKPVPDPRVTPEDGCTLGRLCNDFLNVKRAAVEAGELSPRSLEDYRQTTDRLIAHFGKSVRVDFLTPADFEKYRAKLAAKYGTVTLKNLVNRARVVFKFASDNRLVDSPVYFGQSFNRPSAKSIRKARNEAGPRLFEPEEVRRILDALAGKPVTLAGEHEPESIKADPQIYAMVLLGVNCGFGNTDVASLPRSAVDLDSGWIEFPRPKTEINRRVPLWPETVAAVREALNVRPEPATPSDDGLCFLTRRGKRWTRSQESLKHPGRIVQVEPLAKSFAKLLKRLGINGRKGLGFYTLRHNFQTIGGDAKDPEAVAQVMGHVDSSMGAVYRERIPDERLQAVVDVVRAWLFPERILDKPE